MTRSVEPLSVTDVPYTWSFFPGLSPINLSHIAMMHGHSGRDLTKPFRYLELGCGNGLCVSTLASCFPQAEFQGVDLNADHIRRARQVARAGELNNTTYHHCTFAEFLEGKETAFDFITLHGVYAWVPPEVRGHIHRILQTRLAPGGIVYATYNAMPGWAPLLPLRKIMWEYTETRKHLPLLERVSEALAYLRYLRDNEADYFRDNPLASRWLDRLLGSDPRYLAHEYFSPHWNAFYFSEVHAELTSCGLTFAGTSPLLTNIDALNIPERFHRVLDTAPDRLARQTHRAFVINELFRRDVYVRPPVEQRSLSLLELWGPVVFGPRVPADRLTLEVPCPIGTATLTAPIYEVLLEVLRDQAYCFAELRTHPELAEWDDAALLQALHGLCATEQVSVFASHLLPPNSSARLRLSAFNRYLLQERIGVEKPTHLASPVVGTGLEFTQYETLLTLAIDQAGPDGLAEWACDFLERRGHSLTLGEKSAEQRSDQLAILEAPLPAFLDRTLPRLVQYGILT